MLIQLIYAIALAMTESKVATSTTAGENGRLLTTKATLRAILPYAQFQSGEEKPPPLFDSDLSQAFKV
jgi:hypothetical protein